MLALNVAILPPPDVAALAERLSASLVADRPRPLRLGPHHLPHITLTQQFVRTHDLERVFAVVDQVMKRCGPLHMRVSGSARAGRSVWMSIESRASLVTLHEDLMEALQPFEQVDGDVRAFADADTLSRAVAWVARYRTDAAFASFRPHITLGHAEVAPDIEPIEFVATTVAACHLGHFGSCRSVLRRWRLGGEGEN